jgi:hypothetical protein
MAAACVALTAAVQADASAAPRVHEVSASNVVAPQYNIATCTTRTRIAPKPFPSIVVTNKSCGTTIYIQVIWTSGSSQQCKLIAPGASAEWDGLFTDYSTIVNCTRG